VLIWPGANDIDGMYAWTVALYVPYDTSSGDSCWVRQYLGCYEQAISVPTKTGMGFVPARIHRFHAT